MYVNCEMIDLSKVRAIENIEGVSGIELTMHKVVGVQFLNRYSRAFEYSFIGVRRQKCYRKCPDIFFCIYFGLFKFVEPLHEVE